MSKNNSELTLGVERLCSLQEKMMQAQLELIAGQQELILLLKGQDSEDWITKKQAMEKVLFVSESTFYRAYEKHGWPRKKIGQKWYYLKNAMLREA